MKGEETKQISADAKTVRVPLGQLFVTPGAFEAVPAAEMESALGRHSRGDWGNCSSEDAAENELSLKEGFRLLSVYETRAGITFWVITEADRSVTTVLLPEEY